MQQINISELKPHPRNNEFFDDIAGDKWEELLESIRKRVKEKKRGNIEPIIITQDKVIVSGHQRVRAFKELGISTIESEIRIYNSDDEILLDLLESNIRRRGEVGGSAKKVGKRIKELERLYGIKQGGSGFYGNQYTEILESLNNFKTPRTQEQLAKDMGMMDAFNNSVYISGCVIDESIKDCLIFTFFDKVNYPVDKDTFIEISYENLMEWCEKINMVCHVENDKLSE